MCYKYLYISLPSYAQQRRKMIRFCVFLRTRTTAANFWCFKLELNAGVTYQSLTKL